MSGGGQVLDRLAVALSSLCVLHCVATPILIGLLPTMAVSDLLPEKLHIWLLLLALPVSAFGLWSGLGRHGQCLPVVAAVIGLALLAFGAFAASATYELALTICGATILAAAHLANARIPSRRAID
jgi:MerC mercury resistance protein